MTAMNNLALMPGYSLFPDWRLPRTCRCVTANYLGENDDGVKMPALNVFARRNGAIVHAYCTEIMVAKAAPGQDPRHVDMIWPVWSMLDFTPEGRGDWYPE